MNCHKIIFAIISCFSLLFPIFVSAQESAAPNIAYVFPAGAQRGAKLNILIGGNKFQNTDRIVIEGGGIKAKILAVDVPFTEGQRAQLRMKLEKEFILANPGMKEKIEALGKDGQRFLRNETMKIPEYRMNLLKKVWTHILYRPYIKWSDGYIDTHARDMYLWFKLNAWSVVGWEKLLWTGIDDIYL